MKKLITIFIALAIVFVNAGAYADEAVQNYANDLMPASTTTTSNASSYNQISTSQNLNMQGQGYGYGEGGSANAEGGDADSIAITGDSGAIANISTNSTSNYESRTPPVAMFPPYLPTFSHGGWGTIQAYFPNGPTSDDRMYECAFYPDSGQDMKELKGVISSLSYDGPLELLGGILNGIGTLLGGPDNFHHGRGFEIANSVVRKRRPEERPLIILIDSQINREYLSKTGYAYVGKISLEGKINRNWDQVYKAAIAEVLPWDVDIMLISGGMKGVTVGSNFTFPSAGGAYAQTNYSMTLLGGNSTGITEGKGEAMVSAECFRYYPDAIEKRTFPDYFYSKVHATQVSNVRNYESVPAEIKELERIEKPEMQNLQSKGDLKSPEKLQPSGSGYVPVPQTQQRIKGVTVSPELYDLAGF